MYAVIFRAEIDQFDDEYTIMAEEMRELALNKYGCLEFTSCAEGNQEIAISYRENKSQIKAWKQNAEHLVARKHGKNRWYKSYRVQIVDLVREYQSS